MGNWNEGGGVIMPDFLFSLLKLENVSENGIFCLLSNHKNTAMHVFNVTQINVTSLKICGDNSLIHQPSFRKNSTHSTDVGVWSLVDVLCSTTSAGLIKIHNMGYKKVFKCIFIYFRDI